MSALPNGQICSSNVDQCVPSFLSEDIIYPLGLLSRPHHNVMAFPMCILR